MHEKPILRFAKNLCWMITLALVPLGQSFAQDIPIIRDVEVQPLKAQARRVEQALQYLAEPLTPTQHESLEAALAEDDAAQAVEAIQKVLDQRVIALVNVNPESRVKVAAGPAPKKLVQQGWQVYLVKVHNEAGVTAKLSVSSPNALPMHRTSSGSPSPAPSITLIQAADRWLDLQTFDSQPLAPTLSGLSVEYRIVQMFSRDAGKHEATLAFDVGQGTQDLGFRNEVAILFECALAVDVTLEVTDENGKPTTASFVFRDGLGRVYPARSRRVAPDFFFHDQIYRKSGETIRLPPGEYTASCTRGPEYLIESRKITVPVAEKHREAFQLKRWIRLANYGWFSGDHHVHSAGCAHYESPMEGVGPEDMMRHLEGENLDIGCVLAWGPCWYSQKKFFSGQLHELSTPDCLMRYDVEVSGFPSSHCGHLCLLRLGEDDFEYSDPVDFEFRFGAETGRFKGNRTAKIAEWPSWDLPVLQWAKRQGGVVGFAHSGWGLQIDGDELPNYNLPPYDGIGANEYIVDVCHDAVDFISTVDTPPIWELNIWYQTLNCGYTCRISGETDFPCIYGERVGLGRVYVKLPSDKPLNYDDWVKGLKDGRSYVTDGLSHLIDFNISGLAVGEIGAAGRPSVLSVKKGQPLSIKVDVAALLGDQPDDAIRRRPLSEKPYWHLERARIADTKRVPVELVVNGVAVERREIEANGKVTNVSFDYVPERSSWIAVRIFPSSHTNPIFVEVDGAAIRASRRSAQWCLDSVEQCWKNKSPQIRPHELPAARAAYDFAREQYQQILRESFDDSAQEK